VWIVVAVVALLVIAFVVVSIANFPRDGSF
jgi:hypothetical protein